MDIFDLPGPQFLGIYIPFAVVVAALAVAAIMLPSRDQTLGPPLLADPFQIAYLRGGFAEMIRLAVVSLADRGQVELPRLGVIAPSGGPVPGAAHPIERAILTNCPRPTGRLNALLRNSAVREACRATMEPLVDMRLAPSPADKRRRAAIALGAWVIVGAVGFTKLMLAIERGRPNIEFLMLTMFVATIFFLVLAVPRLRTAEGRHMLAALRDLLAARRDAPRPGSPPSEALLLAAVFGSAGLSGFTDMRALYQRAGWNSNSSCGGGSSCGGSSGCGGGGGCGGCGSS